MLDVAFLLRSKRRNKETAIELFNWISIESGNEQHSQIPRTISNPIDRVLRWSDSMWSVVRPRHPCNANDEKKEGKQVEWKDMH